MSGPDRISPIGPHRNAQNPAATSWATSERPMLGPYSIGSKTLLQTSSRPMNTASTPIVIPQPSVTASVNRVGGMTPIQVPMYGT